VTAFWCELAWLGGAEPQAGVLIETDGERIASIAAGVAAQLLMARPVRRP